MQVINCNEAISEETFVHQICFFMKTWCTY